MSKESLQQFVDVVCIDDQCSLEKFEQAFVAELDPNVTQAFESLQFIRIIRFIRDNWSILLDLTSGNIGRLIRFIISKWDDITALISDWDELTWQQRIEEILQLISDFMDDQLILDR